MDTRTLTYVGRLENNSLDGIGFIFAGGTFEAEPYPSGDVKNPPPVLPAITDRADRAAPLSNIPKELAGLGLPLQAAQWEEFPLARGGLKDSQDLTPEDIAYLAERIAKRPEQFIVLTIGSSKAPDHARELSELLKNYPDAQDKTILIPVAMSPLTMLDNAATHGKTGAPSNGIVNLNDAVKSIKFLAAHAERENIGKPSAAKPNVYVLDDGKVYHAEGLQKIEQERRFEGRVHADLSKRDMGWTL